jgi:hypothetical protein
MLAAAALAVLVPLFAPFAPPFGVCLIEIEQGEQTAQHGQGSEERHQVAAGAGPG